MDKEEAKLILANYTLVDPPKDDPLFQEALNAAERDASLMEWWIQAKKDDQRIRDGLKTYGPPPELRTALSSSMEGVAKQRSRRRTIVRYLALAASLTLAVNIYFKFIVDHSDSYSGPFVDRAFNYSFDGPRLKYFNKDTTKITDWLVSQNFDLPDELPERFLDQKGIGCRPLNWSDNKVAIICVNAGVVYHLFVTKEEDFSETQLTESIQFEERKAGWTVSKWKSQGHLFVLTAKANPDELGYMLAGYSP